MKKITLSLISIFLCSVVFAQAVLTASTSNLIIGEEFATYYCKTAGVTPGAAGAGIVWNFSGLTDSSANTISIIDCAGEAYCDSFPVGFIVMAIKPLGMYQAYAADALKLDYTNLCDSSIPGWATFVYGSRPYNMLRYPLTYTDAWHDTSLYRVPSNHQQHTFADQLHSVDGHGTLITPRGTYTNVLRLHVVNFVTDTQFVSSTPSIYHVRMDDYYWYQPGFHNPILMMTSLNDSATGALLKTGWVRYSTGIASAGTRVPEHSDLDISVFPIPAREFIYVKSGEEEIDQSSIVLLDITGRVVDMQPSIIQGSKHEIAISTASLPSGMYMIRFKAGHRFITKKVVVNN